MDIYDLYFTDFATFLQYKQTHVESFHFLYVF